MECDGKWLPRLRRQPYRFEALTVTVNSYDLDDVDRGILHLLQQNARDATIEEMGEAVGVSASTVRNRIGEMEDAGVIEGYVPRLNYPRAGFDLHTLYICKAPVEEREQIVASVLEVSGVVEVHELLDSSQNVVVEAVASDADHLARTHDTLVELGMNVRQTLHIRRAHSQPFDHFGADVLEK